MKLGWYLARLRNMSAGEILHRLAEARHRASSRNRHEGWERFSAGPLPLALPGLDAPLRLTEDQGAALAIAAAGIMDGRFSALGQDWPQRSPQALFPPALWQLSPESGKAWPGAETYCFDIDFRQTATVGDIKYAWELNRLQFLQPLAAQVAASGGAAELAAVETAIESWHAANPPYRGIGWASGIEVALRAISLLIVVSFCGASLSRPTLERIGAILRASLFWLERFPSHFSSANNHLIAELAGRYLVGVALGVAKSAASAQAELEAEVLRQILPDGVGAEQSPTYSAFTAELGLLCALVARQGQTPFQPDVDARLGRFADFIFWLSGPDGRVPAIGDDDEGRAVTLCRPERDYAVSVAVAIKGFLGQGAPLAAPSALRNAIFGAPARVEPFPDGVRTFPLGGYSVWRGRHAGHDIHTVLDHGPLGYLSIAAHGHADALAVWLAIDGKPVLVDPGTYRYQAGGPWRGWFRSTRAHNTLTLGGAGQSLAAGAFNWSHKAAARLDAATASPWRIVASHDGYRRRFGTRHQRTLALTTDGLLIEDRLPDASAPLPAELTFQLAADLDARIEDNRVFVSRAGAPVCQLVLPDPGITIVRAAGPELGGWVSPNFGSRIAADRVVWSGVAGASGLASRVVIEG